MSLHRLVVEAAERTPEASAVHDMTGGLSYRRLDALADQYAAALLDVGVRPGDRVLLWTGKSAEVVALMQAVLRIGAIYVPVTPSNPIGRVRRIVADCRPSLVVTDLDDAPDPADLDLDLNGLRVAVVDRTALRDAAEPGRCPAHHPAAPDDPAYILYTSGSTGEPKGVCLSHRNALSFIDWAAEKLRLRPADRLANHAPFTFDLSVFDLYGAFRAGASVHLVPDTLAHAPDQLIDVLAQRRITVWYSVPSAFLLLLREGRLLDRGPLSLRTCVFAGEAFPLEDIKRLRAAWPGIRLLNWYGPTETNVCTSYEVTAADLVRTTPLPIGTGCCGNDVRLEPRPDGTAEIVVSGPTVMLGYWGRPPHHGPYRTGDLGRRDARGDLEYLGRFDDLAKVRGHRVEPGEVEAALGAHPAVGDVVVLVSGGSDAARLHAVVVPRPGQRPQLLDLKRHCASLLPSYMIIDAVHTVEAIPRGPNGKTDRAALVRELRTREPDRRA
ncbi:amino acid adenylation domain-containing protein [Streptomyces sp. FXJ1.4098]|nr:amino acid adenylation domain-containing protein [Streptomyces sp. FXJ1.4098]